MCRRLQPETTVSPDRPAGQCFWTGRAAGYNTRVLSKAWRILVMDGLAEAGLRLLSEQAEVVERETLDSLADVHALIVRGRTKVTADAIASAGADFAVIGRAGVGVDNIDLAAAQERGIPVVNAPDAATEAVAELTLGLMLALARHIPAADTGMRAGDWAKKRLKGTELSGKNLGVIGIGRIGAAVAARATAFGMHVVAHDPIQ